MRCGKTIRAGDRLRIRTYEIIALAGLADNRRDRDRFQQKDALAALRWPIAFSTSI
jgi:hypothetical protein